MHTITANYSILRSSIGFEEKMVGSIEAETDKNNPWLLVPIGFISESFIIHLKHQCGVMGSITLLNHNHTGSFAFLRV
jgi:hypothetical protein